MHKNNSKIYCFVLVLVAFFGSPLEAQDKIILEEVRNIMENTSVQDAFEYLDSHDTETLETLITLTEIPAPPFAETERALAFLEMLNLAGIDTSYIDEVGNVMPSEKDLPRIQHP